MWSMEGLTYNLPSVALVELEYSVPLYYVVVSGMYVMS